MLPLLLEPDRETIRPKDVRQRVMANAREAFRGSTKGLYRDLKLLTSDWVFDAERIAIPVQFWYGDRDNVCPPSEIISLVASSGLFSLTVIFDEGHYSLPIRRRRMLLEYFV
jgi:pimeloyl-ACP methyl ester carboxylesterase